MSADGGVILVGGEALFDVVAGDGDALEAHPGGGPFNAARTIARLEQPVAYLGRLSTDRFGDRLERILLDDGVSLESVVRTDAPADLDTVVEAATFACVVATRTCERAGASPPDRREL